VTSVVPHRPTRVARARVRASDRRSPHLVAVVVIIAIAIVVVVVVVASRGVGVSRRRRRFSLTRIRGAKGVVRGRESSLGCGCVMG
jgi:hypothetical protein